MPQTLRTKFPLQPHSSGRRNLLPARAHAACGSLEALLIAMQLFLATAQTDLLKPRQQAIDFILSEAAKMESA
jgi:hypothetical protein